MEIMKAEYEDRLQETNGSYFALKLAHGHLENRLKSFEQNKTKADKELEIYKQKTVSFIFYQSDWIFDWTF